jgi:hypothetical protein
MEGIMTAGMSRISNSVVWCIIAMALVASAQFGADPALADGAVALGRPGDIAKAGVAIGISSNFDDNDRAHQAALEKCRANQDAPQSTKSLCKLIAYFKDQCASVAIDKKAGTPGFGWSIGVNKASAQREAMAVCKATAGKSRENFCENSIWYCDGSAAP